MIRIKDILEECPGIQLTVTAGDLRDFARHIIDGCMESLRDAGNARHEQEEKPLTREQLCQRWHIAKSTLHNWQSRGLVRPVKIGNRVLFNMDEVMRAEAGGVGRFRR